MLYSSKKFLYLTLLIAFLFTLWVQLPNLRDPFLIEEDVRNLPWVWLLTETDLFPHFSGVHKNILFVTVGHIQWPYVMENPVYGLIVQMGSYFWSPLTVVKLLPFLLMLVAVYYAYRLGETAVSPSFATIYAITFAALNLTLHTEVSVIAGLQRSFVCPLLLALAYYLHNGRYPQAAFTLFLAATIYIPILPVMMLTYLLGSIRWQKHGLSWAERINKRAFYSLMAALITIFIFMLPFFQQYLQPVPVTTLPGITIPQLPILQNPHYSVQGPKPLFIFFPFIGRGGIASGPSVGILIGLFALFLVISYPLLQGQFRRLPRVLRDMFYASIFAYVLAWLSIVILARFLFYIPSRHTQSSLFIILLFLVLLNGPLAFQAWSEWISHHRRGVAITLLLLALLALVGFSGLMLWQGVTAPLVLVTILCGALAVISWLLGHQTPLPDKQSTQSTHIPAWLRYGFALMGLVAVLAYLRFAVTPFHNPSTDERATYQFLQTLPKDTVIGGHPCTMDDIPLYVQLNILFNCEIYSQSDPVSATLEAYYSSDAERIVAYCEQYGVDYLVVDTEKWLNRERVVSGKFFYEPYASAIQPELLENSSYFLATIPPERRLFSAGPIFVVQCSSTALNG